jgi:hypothetical protein
MIEPSSPLRSPRVVVTWGYTTLAPLKKSTVYSVALVLVGVLMISDDVRESTCLRSTSDGRHGSECCSHRFYSLSHWNHGRGLGFVEQELRVA